MSYEQTNSQYSEQLSVSSEEYIFHKCFGHQEKVPDSQMNYFLRTIWLSVITAHFCAFS